MSISLEEKQILDKIESKYKLFCRKLPKNISSDNTDGKNRGIDLILNFINEYEEYLKQI